MFKRTKIGFTSIKIKYLAKGNVLTYDEILALLHSMFLYVLDELILELKIWIKTKVPKRTGQLRDNMLRQLDSSNVKKGLMRLVLGTNIDYAPQVAEMTTTMVRHVNEVGYAYYYGKSGKILLNDPQAIGNFWEELLEYAEERTMFILQRAIDEYFAGTGTLIKQVRGKI
ncbi:hypothetical protein LCGC14_0952100 [marine sediment metagenome]|uniref:Uncharacterized protein n=1 Tax=marine sediment metagenome TaxID=412755 RepID=A0A0F9R0G2_9ZZZZ